MTDAEDKLTFLNALAEDLLGLSSEEAAGKHINTLFHFKQAEEDLLRSLEADPQESANLSTGILIRTDGLERVVLTSKSPAHYSSNGAASGNVISFRDISGIKQTELSLREANDFLSRCNERLSQLSYSLSHDLQEPLRTIKIASELLRRKHNDSLDESGRQYLGFIQDGCSRMGGLLTSLLEYYRAGSLENLTAALIDAEGPLQEALANLQAAITTSGARIERTSLPEIYFHPIALMQVFQNLIGNAIKYRGEQTPVVQISASRNAAFWTIEIRDNGSGFDSAQSERIFDLFTRAHGRDLAGSGVGLATCRKLVEHYGGSIWAESEPNQGSIFRFSARAQSQSAAA